MFLLQISPGTVKPAPEQLGAPCGTPGLSEQTLTPRIHDDGSAEIRFKGQMDCTLVTDPPVHQSSGLNITRQESQL